MASTAFEFEDQNDDDFFDKLIEDDDDISFPRPVTSTVDGVDSNEVKVLLDVSEVGSVGGESVGDIGFGEEDDEKGVGDEVGSVPCDSVEDNSAVTDSNVPSVSNVVGSSVTLIETEGAAVNSSLTAGVKEVDSVSNVVESSVALIETEGAGVNSSLIAGVKEIDSVSNVVESSVALIETEGAGVNSSLIAGVKEIDSVSYAVESSVALIEPEASAVNSSLTAGVKEIDWSAFNSESYIHTGVRTGSYSDLFNEFGESSEDPFAMVAEFKSTNHVSESPVAELRPERNEEVPVYATALAQTVDGQDLNSSQYWEDLYPGWRFDPTTGQWHQLDDKGNANTNLNVQDNTDVNLLAANNVVGDQNINYLQQTTQTVVGSIAEVGTTKTVSNWNQGTQENAGYPVHMVFDPQFPGWYYDTIVQEWRSLESYTSALDQSTILDKNQQNQNSNISTAGNLAEKSFDGYGRFQQVEKYQSPVLNSPNQVQSVHAPVNSYNQSGLTMRQPEPLAKTFSVSNNQQFGTVYGSAGTYHQAGFNPSQETGEGFGGTNGITGFQNYVHAENVLQKIDQSKTEPIPQMNVSSPYFESKTPATVQQPPLGSFSQFSQAGFNPSQEDTYGQTGQGFGGSNGNTGFQNYVHAGNYLQEIDQSKTEPIPQMNVSSSYFESKTPATFQQPPLGSFSQFSQAGYNPSQENTYGQTGQGFGGPSGNTGFQNYVHAKNVLQKIDQSKTESIPQMNVSSSYIESKTPATFHQPPLGSFSPFSRATSDGRSSAGRPPHALVTFGFGGKLIVMRENNSGLVNSTFNSQDSAGGVVNVFNIAEVVMEKIDDSSNNQFGARGYFQPLCQRPFPGPLVGGSVGSKELIKWVDDKIAKSEYSDPDYSKGEIHKMLFSLLKISCQYYGKLRSPFGSDQALKDDCPESAVLKLFASDRNHAALLSQHGARKQCLQDMPPEPYSQDVAHEVQKLLVSGRKQEALKCAQEGMLWGPALVLASQLGDQDFSETVKQMSLQQLVAGSPLRTLCLLIGGQPGDVFCNSTSYSNMSGPFNTPQQPTQTGSNCMMDEWKENLAIITANRTKKDELVIIHLGDCLWKERGQVTAAHICYLVAEANFESHSDSARLCLIGADHWKFPRTYVNPEAIQRTELYEYSKVLGNPQFLLIPFQPYKIIYAHMLAEVGKLSDSLKYCQAITKSLITGRDPNVDNWKQLVSSLEERIKTHQQGGYGTNMAPTKLVGKLFNFFDNTAHRVAGLPPPVPTSSQNKVKHNEPVAVDQGAPRVFNSQSTMAMSTLIPSTSVEPLNEWAGGGNRTAIPNRSISEPDFGKAPKKVNSPQEENSEKTSVTGGSSRFGRFGSQILQKTVGLVLRSRPDRQAKLGDKNTFYYDEKLKRWVEEGADPPAEEAALPPPPTSAIFQNGVPDQKGINFPNGILHTTNGPDIKNSVTSDLSPGIPPIPPTANQFSSRGRMGARARYVDTFNKGGGTPTNLFQTPLIPTPKPAGGASSPNFFIPAAASVSTEETSPQSTEDSIHEVNVVNEAPSTSYEENSLSSPPSSAEIMQRLPSMDNILQKKVGAMSNSSSPLNPHSRRALSWSGGSLSDANNPLNMVETKPLRATFGMSSSLKIKQVSTGQNSFTENPSEVEL